MTEKIGKPTWLFLAFIILTFLTFLFSILLMNGKIFFSKVKSCLSYFGHFGLSSSSHSEKQPFSIIVNLYHILRPIYFMNTPKSQRKKKQHMFKNWPLIKYLHFLSYPYEVIKLAKFHGDRTKNSILFS